MIQPALNPQRLSDRAIALDCLYSSKALAARDVISIVESAHSEVRQLFERIDADHLRMQWEVFEYAKRNGWYPVAHRRSRRLRSCPGFSRRRPTWDTAATADLTIKPVSTQRRRAGNGRVVRLWRPARGRYLRGALRSTESTRLLRPIRSSRRFWATDDSVRPIPARTDTRSATRVSSAIRIDPRRPRI